MTKKPVFESTSFGSVKVNGKRYNFDILVFPGGEIVRRPGGIGIFGSHNFSLEETVQVTKDARFLVVGTGQFGIYITVGNKHYGSAHLTPRARKHCLDSGIEVVELKTPKAIKKFNELKGSKAAMIHVAC